jgi:ribosomal protein L7/L12
MVQVTPNTVPNMNYDLLWQLRNQASDDIRIKMDQLINERYMELLEQEVLSLRATLLHTPAPKSDVSNLQTLIGTLRNTNLSRLDKIKIVRAAFNLGLVEARNAVDNDPGEDLPF